MGGHTGTLYSGRASSGRTTYFVDVRQAVNGRFFVSVTESRRVSDSGFDQNRIFIFEENLEDVGDVLSKAFSQLQKAREERGPVPGEESRAGQERSGKAWTEKEENLLRKEFAKNTELEGIAALLKRSEYAVTMRLEKLGLMEGPDEGE